MAKERRQKAPPPEIISKIIAKIKATQNKKLRAKMIVALGKLRQPWVVPILIETLADPSEDIRQKVIRELGQWENLACECLFPKLKNQPWYVKVGILQILALRKEPKAVKALSTIINDPNIEVRRHIACCLGHIDTKEGIPLLVKLLKDSSPHVRLAAEEALRRTSRLRFT